MAVERDKLGRFRTGNRCNPNGRTRLSDAERLRRTLERIGLSLESAKALLEGGHGEA